MLEGRSHKVGAAGAEGTRGGKKENTQEEVDSDRNTRLNKMMLVTHQPGMPSFISFSADFQLLIKPDSNGIYF